MPDISKIKLPGTNTVYDIKDGQARSDISALFSSVASLSSAIGSLNSFEYQICTSAANTPKDVQWNNGGTTITGTLVASASTMHVIYLVPDSNGTKDIYDEYITVKTGSTTYAWEKFGDTDIDVGNLGSFAYVNTGTVTIKPSGTNSSSNVSFASHTYATVLTDTTTAKVPAVTGTTKYLTAAATNGAVTVTSSSSALTSISTSEDQFVKSYPGATSKLVTTTVLGLSTSTVTASFASAETAVSVAKRGSQISLANGTLGTETSTRTDNTPMWGATVDESETLIFTFKSLGTSNIYPAAADTQSITPYTFTSVTVPVANASATTVATGGLSNTGGGSTVLTGLGTPTKSSAITSVTSTTDVFAQDISMTTQPTITLTGSTASTTSSIKYTESIATGTTATVTVTFTPSTASAITALGAATAAAQTFTGTEKSYTVNPST